LERITEGIRNIMIKGLFFCLYFFSLILVITGNSCRKAYTPRPRTYVRIDFPEKEYILYDSTAPYCFEYPIYANVVPDLSGKKNPYWFNVIFPSLNGRIYLSYMNINNDLDDLIRDSREFVYKHTIKADQISENPVYDNERNIYGILYDIKGNTASSVQFFVTDSTRHFLRGALYFNTQPDKDSLSPVIQFVREDIIHLINTLGWK